jgi:hypothetical protein
MKHINRWVWIFMINLSLYRWWLFGFYTRSRLCLAETRQLPSQATSEEICDARLNIQDWNYWIWFYNVLYPSNVYNVLYPPMFVIDSTRTLEFWRSTYNPWPSHVAFREETGNYSRAIDTYLSAPCDGLFGQRPFCEAIFSVGDLDS